MSTKILEVGGSMREASLATGTFACALDIAAAREAEIRQLDLCTAGLQMYQPDKLAEAVRWADALLPGTPDYHRGGFMVECRSTVT